MARKEGLLWQGLLLAVGLSFVFGVWTLVMFGPAETPAQKAIFYTGVAAIGWYSNPMIHWLYRIFKIGIYKE